MGLAYAPPTRRRYVATIHKGNPSHLSVTYCPTWPSLGPTLGVFGHRPCLETRAAQTARSWDMPDVPFGARFEITAVGSRSRILRPVSAPWGCSDRDY